MTPVSLPMMINVKQCMVREIIFCISMVAPEKKSLGTTAVLISSEVRNKIF
jgi:hypothetical protein